MEETRNAVAQKLTLAKQWTVRKLPVGDEVRLSFILLGLMFIYSSRALVRGTS
jgi:hypothetical protein